MLEAIEARARTAGRTAPAWAERLRALGGACERLIVLSETPGRARRARCSAIDPERCVRSPTASTRDFSRATSTTGALAPDARRAAGWAPGGSRLVATPTPTSATPRRRPGAALRRPLHRGQARPAADRGLRARPPGLQPPRAARARRRLPGRVGGRAPAATRSRRIGAQDVFLAGWHDHDELPDFLAASDVVVLPSVREQFGQVLVEGMACGLPAIAVDAHGPAEIVDARRDRLAGRARRRRRRSPTRSWRPSTARRSAAGAARRRARTSRERYAWPALAERRRRGLRRRARLDATSLRDERRSSG